MNEVTRLESVARPINGELLDHGQASLVGATLRWKRYRSWNSPTPRSRCELCAAAFTEGGSPGLNSGYAVVGGGPAGQDDYTWICAVCYETRRGHFCWTVLDTNNAPIEPSGLLEAALEWIAWRIEESAD